jgi:uncharacterized protein YcbK (DUF882 family)
VRTGEGTKTQPPFAEGLTRQGTEKPTVAIPSSRVADSSNGGGLRRGLRRFFFAGNGQLKLADAHFKNTLDVHYRHDDGSYDEAALREIRRFFRSRGDDRERPMSLRLVELLAYIQNRYQPRQMTLLSGYRSPEFNADLGASGRAVAMASLHTQGLAADIAFSGIDLRQLWGGLRELKSGGAGYYRKSNFLHIDVGPPRFWEETTSRVSENLSAGNARMFVRSDFDVYDGIEGAVLSLHSVTSLPLRIAPQARLVGKRTATELNLQPVGDLLRSDDGCWIIEHPAESYELTVASVGAVRAAPSSANEPHSQIVVTTCSPRYERTPLEARSNEIDVSR